MFFLNADDYTIMPPQKKTLNTPVNGWESQSFYIIDASVNPTNPIWRSIFYSGFVDDNGIPQGYNQIMTNDIYERLEYSDLHYIKVIAKIDMSPDNIELI